MHCARSAYRSNAWNASPGRVGAAALRGAAVGLVSRRGVRFWPILLKNLARWFGSAMFDPIPRSY